MENNEQEAIRRTQGRLLTAIDFHEQHVGILSIKLDALRKRCQHPRLVGEVVLCPDCGYEQAKRKGKKVAA